MIVMNAVQHWHSVQKEYCPHMCKAGVNVVFTLTLQYHPPDVSYEVQNPKIVHICQRNLSSLSCLMWQKVCAPVTSGERKAEILMTLVCFGVTRLRTC